MTTRPAFTLASMLLMMLALTSCAYAPAPKSAELPVPAENRVGLAVTPPLSARPLAAFAAPPAGWVAEADLTAPARLRSRANGCRLDLTSLALPASRAGQGDLSLTGDAFATFSMVPGATLTKESITQIPAGEVRAVDFRSGVLTTESSAQWVAVRAFDHVFAADAALAPAPEGSANSGNIVLGSSAPVATDLPAFAIAVTCSSGKKLASVDLAAILSTISVTLTP